MVQQYRYDYPPDLDWPGHFQRINNLAWLAVILLLADVVVEALRRRARGAGRTVNPSPWITRFGPSVATGRPRARRRVRRRTPHTLVRSSAGHRVVAVDRDLSGVADLRDDPHVELVEFDLEAGATVPVRAGSCSAVVVTNYLWRPILDDLVARRRARRLVAVRDVRGGQRAVRTADQPRLPAAAAASCSSSPRRHELHVVAYEDVVVDEPKPAAVQRLAAVTPR